MDTGGISNEAGVMDTEGVPEDMSNGAGVMDTEGVPEDISSGAEVMDTEGVPEGMIVNSIVAGAETEGKVNPSELTDGRGLLIVDNCWLPVSAAMLIFGFVGA